jgi:hypothetical protein
MVGTDKKNITLRKRGRQYDNFGEKRSGYQFHQRALKFKIHNLQTANSKQYVIL